MTIVFTSRDYQIIHQETQWAIKRSDVIMVELYTCEDCCCCTDVEKIQDGIIPDDVQKALLKSCGFRTDDGYLEYINKALNLETVDEWHDYIYVNPVRSPQPVKMTKGIERPWGNKKFSKNLIKK